MGAMPRRDTYQQAMNAANRERKAQQKLEQDYGSQGRDEVHIPRKHVPYERPVLTQEEKDAMEARAKAALRAEWEETKRDRATSARFAYCEFCGEPATKRTLCENHYKSVLRAGELEAYPTKQFLDNPSSYAVWLIDYYPELLFNAATQAGWDVTRPEP